MPDPFPRTHATADEAERFVNHPTDEGRALGREVARLADAEFAANPALRPRCHDCAFLAGTEPNSIAGTLMNALKCAIERDPFYCHVIPADGRQRLCAGWEAMLNRGEPMQAPWPYIEAAGDDPFSRCVPEPAEGVEDPEQVGLGL
jgi:hypothetical protein